MAENGKVYGYHGTSLQLAAVILQNGFNPSQNDYDWLGDGIYFWQDAPARAWEWAKQQHGTEAAVIVAEISMRDCIDLLDIEWFQFLTEAYNSFMEQLRLANLPHPRQTSRAHRLDREVVNYSVGILAEQGTIVSSVRAAFSEGNPVYPLSALFDRSHVQIAVRDPSLIERVWLLDRQEGDDVKSE